MNPECEFLWSGLRQRFPITTKLSYPRHIATPGGYTDPKWYGLSLSGSITVTTARPAEITTDIAIVLGAYQSIRLGVPTYFLGREFIEAVARTTLPKGMTFADIKWPMDSMLFVLPTQFMWSYFGYNIPFICANRIPVGEYPSCLLTGAEAILKGKDQAAYRRLSNILNLISEHGSGLQTINNESDRVVFHFMGFGVGVPIDYVGIYGARHGLEVIGDSPFTDGVDWAAKEYGAWYEEGTKRASVGLPTKDDEREVNLKAITLATQLMLVLNSTPTSYIEEGEHRPASTKKGKARREIWNPNYIGRSYRIKRPALGGTHASPTLHWRRGHLHTVLHGPGKTLRDVRWFPPVLVNAPDGTPPWQKTRPL